MFSCVRSGLCIFSWSMVVLSIVLAVSRFQLRQALLISTLRLNCFSFASLAWTLATSCSLARIASSTGAINVPICLRTSANSNAFRVPVFEGFPCGLQKYATIKQLLRQTPNVVEILHVAIQGAEVEHGLEFFCQNGFGRIEAQNWRGVIKQRRILIFRCSRVHNITESDIELHADAGVSQKAVEPNPYAFIVGVFLDALCFYRVGIEDPPVFGDIDAHEVLNNVG